jgi:hypothetical protein
VRHGEASLRVGRLAGLLGFAGEIVAGDLDLRLVVLVDRARRGDEQQHSQGNEAEDRTAFHPTTTLS